MQLTSAQTAELVDAIENAFSIERLDILVALSLATTRESITTATTKTARVLAIIEEAASTDRLHHLLNRAQRLNESNLNLAAVSISFLGLERMIPASTLDEVIAVIRSANPLFTDSELRRAWRYSVPTVIAHDYDKVSGDALLNAFLSRMAEHEGPPQRSPILEFLIHLREERLGDHVLADGLKMSRLKIQQHLIKGEGEYASIDRAAHETRQRAFETRLDISIIVAPALDDRFERYDVDCHETESSVLDDQWEASGSVPHRIATDCEDKTIEGAVANHLRNVLDATEIPSERIAVHLFLPLTLWSSRADQWPLPGRLHSQPLGAELDVLIRSWERPWDSSFLPAKKAWKRLWEQHLRVPKAGKLERAQVRNLGLRLKADRYTCAAFSFALCAGDFDEVVDSGVPIAVWVRDKDIPESQLAALAAELSACPADWIERVKQYRIEAARDGEGVGEHFFLMWDDPRKLPPSASGRVPLEEQNGE